MSLSYALYPNKVSKGTNAYRALIKGRRKVTLDEIINRMSERHAGITKGEAMAVLELFMNEVEYILEGGGVVSTPLFYAQCSVSGNFNNSSDYFHKNRHAIKINLRPGNRLKAFAQEIKANRVQCNIPGPIITNITDMSTGVINSQITPGASAIIRGKRLQFNQDDPHQGIFFTGSDNAIYKADNVFLNTFSQLYVVIPETLPEGTYSLEVRSALKTKSLRTGGFASKLTFQKPIK